VLTFGLTPREPTPITTCKFVGTDDALFLNLKDEIPDDAGLEERQRNGNRPYDSHSRRVFRTLD
jgi:hypothetical protein